MSTIPQIHMEGKARPFGQVCGLTASQMYRGGSPRGGGGSRLDHPGPLLCRHLPSPSAGEEAQLQPETPLSPEGGCAHQVGGAGRAVRATGQRHRGRVSGTLSTVRRAGNHARVFQGASRVSRKASSSLTQARDFPRDISVCDFKLPGHSRAARYSSWRWRCGTKPVSSAPTPRCPLHRTEDVLGQHSQE